jgi:hypothetical protein
MLICPCSPAELIVCEKNEGWMGACSLCKSSLCALVAQGQSTEECVVSFQLTAVLVVCSWSLLRVLYSRVIIIT